MPIYPTPEEIMAEPAPQFTDDILSLMQDFKQHWRQHKNMTIGQKYDMLCSLLVYLNLTIFGNGHIGISILEDAPTASYNPETNVITLNNPSIISALHEFGHKVNGPNELLACRFSVHLFKQTFPKAFARLHWEGHLLKK
jgi:hypothetical protein